MSMRAVIALSMLGFLSSQSGRDGISPNGGRERFGKIARFASFDFYLGSAFPRGCRTAFTETS
ncbi:hypothetical protein RJJ37_08060 [Rhizobium redzepovicii]|uniref:Uncharacterized protein n=1 Tax=Rhizobium redzepovicii TaxID=2867518 RepID=A0AAW8NXH3_9HYPH|nr:hypothetical protein [Rhizobium redzepovicii]MDR9759588.1 hypothetical protein [Rhizobium redzepovicii]